MNLIYVYFEGRSDGVFGAIYPTDENGMQEPSPICVFVTHAYKQEDGTWRPKTRAGVYDCVRGTHHLGGHNGKPAIEFETFEITGVPGHSGILNHWGSWGSDSQGCFCLGAKIVKTDQDRDGVDGPDEMVTESRKTFAEFMAAQAGVDTFKATVVENFQAGR